MNNKAIESTILSLQAVYNVMLGLSLGEALKQFVADNATLEAERRIHWDRFPNLVAFLFLLVPFFQGMNRYFFDAYIATKVTETYGLKLLFDCVIFTIEGGVFFALSRWLPLNLWKQFYGGVVFLLSTDVIWGLVGWYIHPAEIRPWVFVNVFAIILLIIVWWRLRLAASKRAKMATGLCLIIVIVRTICDYLVSWNLYFPKVLE